MADDLGERSEEATPKRRQDSRLEGKVAKSQDFSAAVMLLIGGMSVAAATVWMLTEGGRLLAFVLDSSQSGDFTDPGAAMKTALAVGMTGVRVLAPLLALLWIAGFVATLMQVGWLIAPKAIMPKLSKLSPIAGFRRIFGLSALVKMLLDVSKVTIIATVAILSIGMRRDEIGLLPLLPLREALPVLGKMMVMTALKVLAVLLILAILDLIYQRWKYSRDIRMTKQQVKDEFKQSDGDPEVRQRRMKLQQQLASQRVSASVPKADVIVTNPEHISIAIQYAEGSMRAPKVVAKGADHLALRIRQIAMRHGIPIVERRPLARALYREVPSGGEIPPKFYQAVAEILAYVYRISGRRAG